MDPSVWIALAGVAVSVMSLAHSRSKDSTDEVDRKIGVVFSKVDALRADLAAIQRQIDKELIPRTDVRELLRDQTERIARHEGRIETVLEALTALRERLAARGREN